MITYKDIKDAINRQLKKTGIDVNSRDVTEGFERPSFFVQLDNVNRSGDESQVYKAMTVQIYYFPPDRYEYSITALEMQETLENLFDLKLRVKDRYLNVIDFNSGLTDGVLNASFDLEFYEGRKIPYESVFVYVDEHNYPIDNPNEEQNVEFVEVMADEHKIPILDGDGKVVRVEKMGELDFEKE